MKQIWQQRLDAAFDMYFAMSKDLQGDITALIHDEEDSQSSRRNFIRAASALMEGYARCFREMCQVGIETGAGPPTSQEVKILRSERSFHSAERVKLTLQAAYKLFQLPALPEFRGEDWRNAQRLLEKRNKLMHPKSAEDLEVTDELWHDVYYGAIWLFKQLFGFIEQLAIVHGGESLDHKM